MDEGNGSSTQDLSGNNNAGTWSGSTTAGSYYVAGKIGSWAGTFDGTSTYVKVSDAVSLDAVTTWSFAVWLEPTSFTTTDGFAAIIDKNQNLGHIIRFMYNGNVDISTGNAWSILQRGSLGINSWSFLSVTYDGTNIREYLNGVLIGTAAASVPGMGSAPLYIGRRQGSSEPFTGFLDDVRTYNRVLSAAEIQALYNTEK
jgi:hypothetical protein